MVLPDVLTPGLQVVFCGTAAGTASAKRGAYYAGPGNQFWPMRVRIPPARMRRSKIVSMKETGLSRGFGA